MGYQERKVWLSAGVVVKSARLQTKTFGCFRTKAEARAAAKDHGCVICHQVRFRWNAMTGDPFVAFTYVIENFYGDIRIRLQTSECSPSKTQARKNLDLWLRYGADDRILLPRQIIQLQEAVDE